MPANANFGSFNPFSMEDLANETLPLTGERLGFTLFVSICAHVLLILGVGFSVLDKLESEPSLDITLAQYRSNETPEQADFFAQHNQLGSGNLDEIVAPSTPIQSNFNDDRIQDISTPQQQTTAIQQASENNIIVANTSIDQIVSSTIEESALDEAEQQLDNLVPLDLDQAIASLQAQLDIHREAFANRPRKHTISSATTKQARDALYLDGWRKKIESIGNLNYPEQATREGIYGTLRLLVALREDGSIVEIRILSSSGHNVLDDAAMRIVRLAAPFAAFPESMRQDVDILEIIRTWQFHQSNSLSSY